MIPESKKQEIRCYLRLMRNFYSKKEQVEQTATFSITEEEWRKFFELMKGRKSMEEESANWGVYRGDKR